MYINRDYNNIRLTGFVRGVVQRTDAILNRFLPDTLVRTRTYEISMFQDTEGAAQFRAWDTPVPVTSRPAGERRIGSLPPLGEAMILSENDRLGVYERALRNDFDSDVDSQILDDAQRLTRRVRNRMEVARGQVLSTGALTLTGENGLTLTAPMGVPAANLPGGDPTTTATVAYTNPAAPILNEWYDLQERSRDENGKDLEFAICSGSVIRQMALNDQIRGALAANGTTPALATDTQIEGVFRAQGLPVPVRYDYRVNGQRVIPADRVVMVPRPDADEFGRTEWGVTAEALELGMATSEGPGLVGLVMKSEEPVQVKTKVAGIGMPVLNSPTDLYVVDTTP